MHEYPIRRALCDKRVDAFARVVQAALGAELGQTVIIDNIGGGAGRIGTQAASRGAPDGIVILGRLHDDAAQTIAGIRGPVTALVQSVAD